MLGVFHGPQGSLGPHVLTDWVVKENEWARDKGIPILALHNGDRSREARAGVRVAYLWHW